LVDFRTSPSPTSLYVTFGESVEKPSTPEGHDLFHYFVGFFDHGILEGPVVLNLQDRRKVYLTAKHGVVHGPVVVVGTVFILPVRICPEMTSQSETRAATDFFPRIR
jgi:hypothetical protein